MKIFCTHNLLRSFAALLCILVISASASAEAPVSLESYTNALNRNCQTDQDCAKKNIGNCCGYYPGCVNKNTRTNPELVSKLCAERGLTGICGFPDFENCLCVKGKCKQDDKPAYLE